MEHGARPATSQSASTSAKPRMASSLTLRSPTFPFLLRFFLSQPPRRVVFPPSSTTTTTIQRPSECDFHNTSGSSLNASRASSVSYSSSVLYSSVLPTMAILSALPGFLHGWDDSLWSGNICHHLKRLVISIWTLFEVYKSTRILLTWLLGLQNWQRPSAATIHKHGT